MSDIVVTQSDMDMALDAIVKGWETCKNHPEHGPAPRTCNCDLGKIGGCQSLVARVALAIATARKI